AGATGTRSDTAAAASGLLQNLHAKLQSYRHHSHRCHYRQSHRCLHHCHQSPHSRNHSHRCHFLHCLHHLHCCPHHHPRRHLLGQRAAPAAPRPLYCCCYCCYCYCCYCCYSYCCYYCCYCCCYFCSC
ncbi:unnamed protein product, partial [Closterium sp. NIES-53]